MTDEADNNADEAQMVTIRRQRDDWKVAETPLSALSGFHWSDFSGGVAAASPNFNVYAYVSCNDVIGDIGHSCLHGRGPHSIKVVVLKKDNGHEVMDLISYLAGPKPAKSAKKGAAK